MNEVAVAQEAISGRTQHAFAWWRRVRASPIAGLMAIGAASRVALAIVATMAAETLPAYLPPGAAWNSGPPVIRYFARWDSGYYMDIARLGYGFKPEAWAFDPAYPFTIAVGHFLLPFLDYATIGFLISNACFFGSLVLLYHLTVRLFDAAMAWRTGVFFAVFPGTFYLSAVYSDSLFVLILLAFLLALVESRWLIAGLLASIGALARPTGLVMIAPLLAGIAVETWRTRKVSAQAIWSIPLALEGPILFLGYAYVMTGNPLINFQARATYWVHVSLHNPIPFWFNPDLRASPWYPLWMVGLAILVASTLWLLWDFWTRRELNTIPAYVWSLEMAGIYLFYSEAQPIIRYLVVLIPAYWMLARWSRNRMVFAGLVAISAAVAAVVGAMFALWAPLY
ncbi:MAG: mannosyltransferase family protein [Thermoplasmatota archaeon]